ncbi:MAG: class I SAM-dependent rRNA methyltransferase [Aggregatilineales bacterium]
MPAKPEARAIIRADKTRPFERRHPWIFAGAIQSVQGEPTDGDLIGLYTPRGDFLARGYWNSRSQIRVRALTWDADESIDAGWWAKRLERAIRSRRTLDKGQTNAYRLVNGENDGLPGLVVDRYGDWLVLQAQTLGIDTRKADIAQLLNDLLHPAGIFERSDDADMRHKEGLTPAVGALCGDPPPTLIEISEYGHRFLVDVRNGHKTGFYLDQRETRETLRRWLHAESETGNSNLTVLNCFSYTGGFAVYGLAGGAARVVNVDSSADMLALAQQNVALNGNTVNDADFINDDVFHVLRHYRDSGEQFDVIVLDPPKFAQTQAQVEGACRGYKDINWLAFRLIKPGGLLLTCSCSGAVDADLFQKVVFGALIDAKREAQIIARLGPGTDHPIALTFPEGAYLKGLLCRVW